MACQPFRDLGFLLTFSTPVFFASILIPIRLRKSCKAKGEFLFASPEELCNDRALAEPKFEAVSHELPHFHFCKSCRQDRCCRLADLKVSFLISSVCVFPAATLERDYSYRYRSLFGPQSAKTHWSGSRDAKEGWFVDLREPIRARCWAQKFLKIKDNLKYR